MAVQRKRVKPKIEEPCDPYWRDGKPLPYDENEDPNPFWKSGRYSYKDEGDGFLPSKKGFVTDLIYMLRGTEAPTMFVYWAAMAIISAVVKREAHLKWFYEHLYTNLYVILVGTAGIVKKSSIVSLASALIQTLESLIDDDKFRAQKRLRVLYDKATPEALLEAMEVDRDDRRIVDIDGKAVRDEDGHTQYIEGTSEILIVLPEMGVMINKQSYNESMITNLIRLYDTDGFFEWQTKGGGKKRLTGLHTNMIAATTTDGFKDSIPNAALGDGFISRCIIVYQENTTRRFFPPIPVPSAPDINELRRRLGWIANNAKGEYILTTDAQEYCWEWYNRHRDSIERDISSAGPKSRIPTNLLKVALLLKIQAYDVEDNVIDVSYVRDAARLLRYTYSLSPMIVQEIRGEGYHKWIKTVESYLKRHGASTRKTLLQNTRVNAEDLSAVLEYLQSISKITIWKVSEDGEKIRQDFATRNGNETYQYEEDSWDEEEDDQP